MRFFDDFVEAFATFDGSKVAARYQTPFLAVSSAGISTVLHTGEEIGNYFQSFLDGYHEQGCRSCRYRDLEVVSMGTASGLLTVTWELTRYNGERVRSWRESYVVVRQGTGWRVSVSIDHAD